LYSKLVELVPEVQSAFFVLYMFHSYEKGKPVDMAGFPVLTGHYFILTFVII